MNIDTTKQEPRQATCDKHGEFESRHVFGSIWSKCPTCGAEAQARADAERERRQREDELLQWQRKLGHSGIPDRFQNRSLKSYVAETDGQRRALEFA